MALDVNTNKTDGNVNAFSQNFHTEIFVLRLLHRLFQAKMGIEKVMNI